MSGRGRRAPYTGGSTTTTTDATTTTRPPGGSTTTTSATTTTVAPGSSTTTTTDPGITNPGASTTSTSAVVAIPGDDGGSTPSIGDTSDEDLVVTTFDESELDGLYRPESTLETALGRPPAAEGPWTRSVRSGLLAGLVLAVLAGAVIARANTRASGQEE